MLYTEIVMLSNLNFIILALISAVPLLLWVMGMFGSILSGEHAQRMARLSNGAAGLSFICAALAALLYAADGNSLTVTPFSFALPGNMGALALSIYINAVTVLMLSLVSFVGFVVSRYARNYLQGEKNQGRFYTWLNLTLASILTLIISGNMLMFVLVWMTTSLCLHHLLMFYPERTGAVLAARKKIIASRVGEVGLLIAVLLIGSTLHTMEFETVFHTMATMTGPLPAALQWASGLIVLAAALKSAQFPLQGWLIQVMEAPTPVSALLHAGIVNGGAFLIIRMSPLMSQSVNASNALAIIGLITIATAGLIMLTQTSIKVFLAWTTTAQMGFMLLECGLGLYSLAMLHLVTHSLYKAHAFLSSGSGVDIFRAPAVRSAQSTPTFWQWLVVLAFASLMTIGVGAAFGVALESQPALYALGTIVTVAMTQLLLQSFKAGMGAAFTLRTAGLSALVCTAYFSLHAAFHFMLETSLPAIRMVTSPTQFALVGLVMLTFFSILLIQQNLPNLAKYPMARRAYVHLYNGLYVDIPFSRLLQRFWPIQTVPYAQPKGVQS
ncbi:NADH-quinone oxidoreductase subunit L [mine drainage metagenome]|uniref:NADH-quinone oxidoreductase subunit L n=1 Tax=mine drainage metagenome TaxID=410659 RepID=A0A3P3ZNY9_9ZZZZ